MTFYLTNLQTFKIIDMVIGLMQDNNASEGNTNTEFVYSKIQQFTKEFTNLHHSCICKDLIKCDLTTDKGQEYFKTNNLTTEVCEKCITSAVIILETVIDSSKNY